MLTVNGEALSDDLFFLFLYHLYVGKVKGLGKFKIPLNRESFFKTEKGKYQQLVFVLVDSGMQFQRGICFWNDEIK
jgi:hypothetical protein